MKTFVLFLVVICLPLAAVECALARETPERQGEAENAGLSKSDRELARAYREKRSEFQITLRGTVSRILPDDTQGSRHQQFVVMLSTGQTLLIAHNIDLAPRVPRLNIGDRIALRGEYIWNRKGGIIHKTHHDPDGSEPGGWIRHKGRRYE
jgi:Protein of unknown function (DUF3465)